MASAPGFPPDGETPSPGSEARRTSRPDATRGVLPALGGPRGVARPGARGDGERNRRRGQRGLRSTWRAGTGGPLEGESLAALFAAGAAELLERVAARGPSRATAGAPAGRVRDRAAPLGPAAAGPGVLGREARRLRFRRHGGAPSRAGRGGPRDDPRRRPGRGLLRPARRGARRHAADGDGRRRPPRRGRAPRVRTLAVRAGGAPAEPFTYDLRGAPCEQVVGRVPCVFPSRVAELFPEDHVLSQSGLSSYVGVPLDHGGRQPARPPRGPLPAAAPRRRVGRARPRALRGAGRRGDRATGGAHRRRSGARRRADGSSRRSPSASTAIASRGAAGSSSSERTRPPTRSSASTTGSSSGGRSRRPSRPSSERAFPRRTGGPRPRESPWRSEEVTYADGRIAGAFLVQAFQTAPVGDGGGVPRHHGAPARRGGAARAGSAPREAQPDPEDLRARPGDPRRGAGAGRADRARLRGARRGPRLRLRLGRPAGRAGERGPPRGRVPALRPGVLPDRPQDSPRRPVVRKGGFPQGNGGPGRLRYRRDWSVRSARR